LQIHHQLLNDCHCLGEMPSGMLLLMRNASLPWFILVPATEREDLLDLPADQRNQVLEDCARVSAFIKRQLGYDKVNFAGLGNVVPQMHLHIIGRSAGDACWPQPVWGRLPEAPDYAKDVLEDLCRRLQAYCDLRPA